MRTAPTPRRSNHGAITGRLLIGLAVSGLLVAAIGAFGLWWFSLSPQSRSEGIAPGSTARSVPEPDGEHKAQPADAGIERIEESASPYHTAMNLAKAELDQRRARKAMPMLERALEIRPGSAPALRNLARAYLISQAPEKALNALERAREAEPDSPAAHYITGIALARQNHFERAASYFERVIRVDPHTAAVHFQLANAYAHMQRPEKETEHLLRTVEIDPAHSAAWYRLAMQARERGETEKYRERIREFRRLRNLYGDEYESPLALERCRYVEPEAPEGVGDDGPPPSSVEVKFADATGPLAEAIGERSIAAAALVGMSADGGYTFLGVEPGGAMHLLHCSEGGFRVEALEAHLPEPGRILGCEAGNFADPTPKGGRGRESAGGAQRLTDVLVLSESGVHLLLQTRKDHFELITDAAGLAGVKAHAARWVDYEHDGDLDLLLAGPERVGMWRNNGDRTFEEVTQRIGLPGSSEAAALAALDLKIDSSIDLLFARSGEPSVGFRNLRAGQFEQMDRSAGYWPPGRIVLTEELNNDTHVDAVFITDQRATLVFGQLGKRTEIDLSGFVPTAAALIDYDNDGWLDLCLAGHGPSGSQDGRLRLWRNGGAGEWRECTAELGLNQLSLPTATHLQAADLDQDHDTDLLLTGADGGVRLIANHGGHANGQLKIELTSLVGQLSPIDTHLELRTGKYSVFRRITKPLPIEIGLNGRERLDSLLTFWTNGIVHTLTDVRKTEQPLNVVVIEKIETGSCPFLYAWDGDRFRFVTDLLGTGAIGLPFSRAQLAPVKPRETVVIGSGNVLRPEGGQYKLKITSELREVTYLDHIRLLAVDHPPGVSVASTDRLVPEPVASSELRAISEPMVPTRAMGDDGIDRTAALNALDGRFAPPGPVRPAPLKGVCKPMTLTLEFPEIDPERRPILTLTGWLEYGDASSNIALSQRSDVPVIWPELEAQRGDGQWVPVDVAVGLPAGKTKTILCDLSGKLPPDVQRLRLRTTFEVRWDRIALFERRPLPEERIHELTVDGAELAWHGFSRISAAGPNHPATPAHDRRRERPHWRNTIAGWCTRYGDVRPLLKETDGRPVILNSGDGVTLRFDAEGLPELPDGMARTFALTTIGWNKELNPNTAGPATITPLPTEIDHANAPAVPDSDAWRLRYNTRWVPTDRFAEPRKESAVEALRVLSGKKNSNESE